MSKLVKGQHVKIEIDGTFKGCDRDGDVVVESDWCTGLRALRVFDPKYVTPILPNFELGDLVKHEPTGVVMYFSGTAPSGGVRLATSMYSARQGDFACSMPSNECSIVRKHGKEEDLG